MSRPHHLRKLTLSALLLTLTSTLALTLHAQQDVHASLLPKATRQPAPAVGLPDAQGKPVSLRAFRGKVVLVNFWATDCGGCVLEIPTFVALQKSYAARGYTAVGLSEDVTYEDLPSAAAAWKRITPFAASHAMTYPILLADKSADAAFHITALPATFLLDKQGRIAATYVGIVSKANVAENIKSLLAE